MGKRLLKNLVNNIGFKILAVGFAFVLWLVVYNTNDPYTSKRFTITVTMKNVETLNKEMHKCYEFVDNNNSVTFTVTAKRSYIEKLIESDFVAVADMNNLIMSADGTAATVRIDISSERYSSALKFSSKTQYLKLALEDLTSKHFQINASTYGTVMAGYAIGKVELQDDSSSLRVSGPQSVVSQIDSVEANIDVSDASFDIKEKIVPVFYDKDGKEIDTTDLTLSRETVEVNVQILQTRELRLKFSTIGKPAGKNTVLEVISDPEKIQVKGTSAILNQYSTIEVPAEILDVTGATEDVEKTIDIKEYLPEGIELVSKNDANVKVTVKIKSYISKKLVVSTDNITIEGMQKEYDYQFAASTFSVDVSGEKSALENIKASNIKGIINMSRYKTGTQVLIVKLNLDENTFTCTKVKVKVIVREKNSETTQQSSTDGTDNGSDLDN